MSLNIIIRGKSSFGKTRSEQEANLRKEGYVGMSDENFDKCKWMEKQIKDKYGSGENFVRQTDLPKE